MKRGHTNKRMDNLMSSIELPGILSGSFPSGRTNQEELLMDLSNWDGQESAI